MTIAVQLRIHRRESCARKVAYPTWQEAERAALELRVSPRYESHGYPEMAYHCLYIDHWHVGRNSPKTLQKVRRIRRLLGETE